jgi:hypothetical protein
MNDVLYLIMLQKDISSNQILFLIVAYFLPERLGPTFVELISDHLLSVRFLASPSNIRLG